ncbi:type VI secretion system baseplate subunit TssK, partial [Rhizobium leguminosarum]|uniref:type VI secretion system baseplate subunit TssK n=1 Tax=Rhizobium leguminosarum TaxID=384 RepID=UPI003F9E81EF
CTAAARLGELITELLGIVRHRAEAIAERIGDPTIRGTAEVGDYLLLQMLNRADPMLKHISAMRSTGPILICAGSLRRTSSA